MQFEGKMPQGERITVVIGPVNEHGFLVVHSVADQPSIKANVTDSLKTMITNTGFPLEKNGDLVSELNCSVAKMVEPLMRKSSPICSIS